MCAPALRSYHVAQINRGFGLLSRTQRFPPTLRRATTPLLSPSPILKPSLGGRAPVATLGGSRERSEELAPLVRRPARRHVRRLDAIHKDRGCDMHGAHAVVLRCPLYLLCDCVAAVSSARACQLADHGILITADAGGNVGKLVVDLRAGEVVGLVVKELLLAREEFEEERAQPRGVHVGHGEGGLVHVRALGMPGLHDVVHSELDAIGGAIHHAALGFQMMPRLG
mmetsp:Transcript_22226/g.68452  ORF Transcript_22226/g.68452 Transcript_22226/m.68452 type:complete len:226 (+) Transcript_22226:404-1081(+)